MVFFGEPISIMTYWLTGCKQVPLKGHATTTFENVSQKNWKVFWNIFHFCHRWIWCDEKIKEYLTFYAYFTRMQKFFHFRRWEFFKKNSSFFFRKKTGFVSKFFVNIFSKRIDDNRSAHMISSFPFFILRCNMNTHRQKFWQDTKWMRTEEDSFPIALIHARTILVGLSFTNI